MILKADKHYGRITTQFQLNTCREAEEFLDKLRAYIDRYGFVTLADAYDLLGIVPEFADTKTGWHDLKSVEVHGELASGKHTYRVYLPTPIAIDANYKSSTSTISPSEILRTLKYMFRAKQYTYFIFGEVGPTGKTWLCNMLKKLGYSAFELTQEVNGVATYNDDRNYLFINENERQVTIVLNRRLGRDF